MYMHLCMYSFKTCNPHFSFHFLKKIEICENYHFWTICHTLIPPMFCGLEHLKQEKHRLRHFLTTMTQFHEVNLMSLSFIIILIAFSQNIEILTHGSKKH